jgi:hypothetical protein
VVALYVYRASNVWVDVSNSSCLVLQLQSAEVCRTVTRRFERSGTISECGNEETHYHESRTPYFSLVTVLFTVYAQWPPAHLTWELLRACAASPIPQLNLGFELLPSWNNVHDTFPTGTTQAVTLRKCCKAQIVKRPRLSRLLSPPAPSVPLNSSWHLGPVFPRTQQPSHYSTVKMVQERKYTEWHHCLNPPTLSNSVSSLVRPVSS